MTLQKFWKYYLLNALDHNSLKAILKTKFLESITRPVFVRFLKKGERKKKERDRDIDRERER